MHNLKLWSPSNNSNNLSRFSKKLKKYFSFKSYSELHEWSVKNKEDFWKEVWRFTKIKGKLKSDIYIHNEDFIKCKFFENSKLNYSENCLKKNSNSEAVIFYSEKGTRRSISWNKLRDSVFKLSYFFKVNKINKNDRIAAVLPNLPETVISFLATSQVGAIWSSCSSDFGEKAIIDRFKQIEPKILIITDYYYYNKKKINTINVIPKILKNILSIKKIIVIPYEKEKANLACFSLLP